MTSLADSARRLESLVSPFTGIVRGVDDVLAAPDDIRLVSVFCETGYSRDLVGHGTTHRGAGSGRSRAAAAQPPSPRRPSDTPHATRKTPQ